MLNTAVLLGLLNVMQPARTAPVYILPFTYDVRAIPTEAAQSLEALVRNTSARRLGNRLVAAPDTQQMLDLARSTTPELARAVGTELIRKLPPLFDTAEVVTGELYPLSDAVVMTLRLYSGTSRQQLREVHTRLDRKDARAQTDGVDALVLRLFQKDAPPHGALLLLCERPGGQVRVNSTVVLAACPSEVQVAELAPGAYRVTLEEGGAAVESMDVNATASFSTVVRLGAGLPSIQVDPSLRPAGAEPLPRAVALLPPPGAESTDGNTAGGKKPLSLALRGVGVALAGAGALGLVAGLLTTVLGAVLGTVTLLNSSPEDGLRPLPFETAGEQVLARSVSGVVFLVAGVALGILGLGIVASGVALGVAGGVL